MFTADVLITAELVRCYSVCLAIFFVSLIEILIFNIAFIYDCCIMNMSRQEYLAPYLNPTVISKKIEGSPYLTNITTGEIQ